MKTRGQRHTPEILRRYAAGQTTHEIARALYISQSLVWNVLAANGVNRSSREAHMVKRHREHGNIEARVVSLYRAGHSTYQTAEALSISQGMVWRILRDQKIQRRGAGEAIRLARAQRNQIIQASA